MQREGGVLCKGLRALVCRSMVGRVAMQVTCAGESWGVHGRHVGQAMVCWQGKQAQEIGWLNAWARERGGAHALAGASLLRLSHALAGDGLLRAGLGWPCMHRREGLPGVQIGLRWVQGQTMVHA